jgi:hypothetical protein
LVTTQAEEDFGLDFKVTTYGTRDGAKRDLAGDVAALANTAGGALASASTRTNKAEPPPPLASR